MAAFQAVRQGFESPNPLPLTGIIMSLLSKQDRDLTIEALEFYLFNKEFDLSEDKTMQLNALRNWLQLENFKHEN
jgi:hypothetical protein